MLRKRVYPFIHYPWSRYYRYNKTFLSWSIFHRIYYMKCLSISICETCYYTSLHALWSGMSRGNTLRMWRMISCLWQRFHSIFIHSRFTGCLPILSALREVGVWDEDSYGDAVENAIEQGKYCIKWRNKNWLYSIPCSFQRKEQKYILGHPYAPS